MKATISIEMDNAAFDPHGAELARILRELADRVEGRATADGQSYNLRDANGNRVGELSVTDD